MINEDIRRNYEVSIWTLQDSFITVLKPLNLEYKGTILDPLMTLKDDGENKFSFKIPMYIQNEKGDFIENPIWHNTYDGTILVDLRKIKVIFNKKNKDESIFEFLITNIKESHDKWQKYTEVECEGLAFHELGKQGYKIVLDGLTEIEQEQEKWFKDPKNSGYTSCPKGNLNYWADKIFKDSNWRYSIQMDYSNEDGITHQVYERSSNEILDSDNYENFTEEQKRLFNIWRKEILGLRRRDRVYENAYATSWKLSNDKEELYPLSIKDEQEKYRMIESKESNRYNLSQTVAEVFQVYCKYKYYYDDNYHIIDREAIFYNNFLNESQEVIDLTYKYNTEHLVRTMDSSNLVTKMFVKSIDDADMPSGKVSISDTNANKGLEDYILNFDYMYKIGTISEEQYDRVESYQLELRDLNERYNEVSNNYIIYTNEKEAQETRLAGAESFRIQDVEGLNNAEDLLAHLTEVAGKIEETNPQTLVLIPMTGGQTYYCNFKTQGIDEKTIKLYREYDSMNHTINLNSIIQNYTIVKDDYGNIIRAENISNFGERSIIYATFEYDPQHHANNIIKTFKIRLSKDDKIIAEAKEKLNGTGNNPGLYDLIEQAENEKDALLKEKNKIISDFENFMGPALREGKWQPEDEYSGYGEIYDEECILTPNNAFSNNLLSLGWDEELFDDEQDIKFDYGLEQDTYCYPCIKITPQLLRSYELYDFLEKLTFVYSTDITKEDTYENTIQKAQNKKQYFSIKSKMVFGFLKNTKSNSNKNSFPVLILLEAQKISNEFLWQLEKGYLAIVSSNENGEINENFIVGGDSLEWVIKPTEMFRINFYKTVYPRFQINSRALKNYNTTINIKSGKIENNGVTLQNYDDFYILPRLTAYYITLKPHIILKDLWNFFLTNQENENFNITYSIHFIVSMTALAIYLDALEVLKENSYPKVSYEIDVISANKDFIYDTYKRIGQIAHINDYEFKFQNTLGYISEVDLDLDKPWQDKIIIKNYKTKFEDLFSTIVAQTEEMKKNSGAIGLASNAFLSNGTLNDYILEDLTNRLPFLTSDNQKSIVPEIEYYKYEPYIRNLLRETYYEVGQILSKAKDSIVEVNNLNIQNSDILSLFKEDVRNNMTPIVFTDDFESKRYNSELGNYIASFKEGDIWKRNNGDVYLATANSNMIDFEEENSSQNKEKALLTSLKGWSLIKDGSLAQIKGASLDINSETGKIQILAENEVNIGTGGLLKLAGEDIKITGNNTVEIGGPDIKIYSADINGKNKKGIHIYTSTLENSESLNAIDITGSGIIMRAEEGIKMRSGGGIEISSSDDENTAAVIISRTQGIFLGSSKPIVLYSGDTTFENASSKASVKLSSEEILFGVSNNAFGTSLKITQDYFVIGSGPVVRDENNYINIGTNNVLSNLYTSGVYIDRYTIRLATGDTVNNRSLINMDEEGIYLANNKNIASGAVMFLSSNGIIIGSADESDEYITDIQNSSSTNKHNKMTTYKGAKFQVYAPNFVVNDEGNLYAYNAYIAGEIQSESGKIGSWIINKNYLSSEDESVGMSAINNQNSYAFWAGDGDKSFTVTYGGFLEATGANITGEINASSGSFTGAVAVDEGGCFTTNPKKNTSNDNLKKGITIDSSGIGGSNGSTNYKYFYLSADDGSISANNVEILGGYFKIGDNFEVDSNGEVTAHSIYIDGGEFNINNKFTVSNLGEVTASNIEITGGSIDIKDKNNNSTFTVSNQGEVYASNIEITGGSISIKKNNVETFVVSNQGEVTASNIEITGGSISIKKDNTETFAVSSQGFLTAIFGQIGSWYIGSSYLGSGNYRGNSRVGMTSSTDNEVYAFWAGNTSGRADDVIDSDKVSFYVTQEGYLYASKGLIANWEIKGFTLSSGTSYLNSDSSNNDNKFISANNDNFYVTHAGYLKASNANIEGVINATSGTFNDITIQGNSSITGATKIDTDGKNFSVKSGNFFSMKAIKETVSGEDTGRLTFKVSGYLNGKLNTNLIEVNQAGIIFNGIIHSDGDFNVNKKLYTDQSNIIYSIPNGMNNPHKYTIVVSTNVPSYDSGCDRMLWIKPRSPWNTIDGLTGKALSCEVYWCGKDQ